MSEPVSSGFKQTEAGLIPETWEVVHLGDLGTFSKGKGIRKDDVRESGVPCVRYGEIYTQHHDYLRSFSSYIPTAVAAQSQRLRRGDILFAGSGETAEEIGKCVAFLGDEEAYAGGDIVIFSPLGADSLFLGYLLNHPSVARQKARLGQGDAVVHISARHLSQLRIPLPNLPEQRAIAAALSDADALIAALDRLIAKKRDVKQAAMQELLTGRTRLPGFSQAWTSTRFGAMAQPRSERIDPRTSGFQGFCVELDGIASGRGELTKATTLEGQVSLKTAFTKGDVLFGKLRAYLRKYWLADRVGVCSTEIWALAPARDVTTPEYLRQVVATEEFIAAASESYGTHMPRSDWSIVGSLEIMLPELPEQRAIAAVLSDMDAEIAALEARRDKARLIKEGMAQELLTGRTRLV